MTAILSRWLALALMLPIRLYRLLLSPLLPPVCRFHPSCSVYALGALAVHGPVTGSALALRRITRCHPFNPGGLDPVPPRGGASAATLLERHEPQLASRLREPPPPHLAAVLPPRPPKPT